MLQPGDLCPEFRVQDSDGKTVTHETFAGKRVVLWFYPFASTPG